MREPGPTRRGERVLLLAPTAKDAELAGSVLQRGGIASFCCDRVEQLCAELERGAGAVLLAEEVMLGDDSAALVRWVAAQPPWSDLPVLVLARPGADSLAVSQAIQLLRNVTVLERPIRLSALVSAVRTALRARRRQYETREHLQSLEQADRRKDEFLAILAHELRNPLAPIRNSLHILRLTTHAHPDAEQVCAMMERQINHMVRLVDDLMEVSRITRGKIELRKEPVEVAAVIRSAVETSRPLIDGANHRLVIEIPPHPLTLEGDPVRLAQVFANLLNNAAKYTDTGGTIRLSVHREAGEVVIVVKDSGTGIAPELLPKVFDPFAQGERMGDRAQGGLGIGLTLVKRLVELHGGGVVARSAGSGKGSEFEVRLPLLAIPDVAEYQEPTQRLPSLLAPRRVLVVDDNQDAAQSLAMLLRLLGAQVEVVYRGADALETMATYQPSVVLLDIGMPDLDGWEVARRIRERPEFAKITLIALTGWGQEDDRTRAQLAGFDYHMVKPADVAALENLLVSLES